MQFTLNHAGVEKRARGEMYDAFRLGIATNDAGVQPDYDTVLQSKRQKGYDYKYGILPKGENEDSIDTYFKNQEPLTSGTFKEHIKKITPTATPGPQAAVLPVAGIANPVAGGAPNVLRPPSGGGGGGGGGGEVALLVAIEELFNLTKIWVLI